MTKQQFSDAVKMVESGKDLSLVDDAVLFGCGLPDFKPVVTTIEVCAKHIAWQAMQLNGQWDSSALQETFDILKRKVQII